MAYNLKEDAALKYHIHMHSVTNEYPTKTDLLFDLINFCIKQKKKDLVVTKDNIVELYESKFQNTTFSFRIKEAIKELIEEGMVLKVDANNIKITKQGTEVLFDTK